MASFNPNLLIEKSLKPYKEVLCKHDIYNKLILPEDFRTFMEFHVFSVFENMLLQKRLEMGTEFEINKLLYVVLSDMKLGNVQQYNRLFFAYMNAMDECDADTSYIDAFVHFIKEGKSFEEAIVLLDVDSSIKYYLDHAWTLLNVDDYYKILCSYIYTRNETVMDIFKQMKERLGSMSGFDGLRDYIDAYLSPKFQEKVELKREEFLALIDMDLDKLDHSTQVAVDSFYARMKLWDSIVVSLKSSYVNAFVD